MKQISVFACNMGSDFCLLYIKEPDEAHASSGLLTSVRTAMLHIEVLLRPQGSLSIFSSFNRKSRCPIAFSRFSPMVQHGFFQLTDRRSCPASHLFLPPDTDAHPSYPESRRPPPATDHAHAAPTSRVPVRRRGRQSCARRGIRRAVR